MRTCITALCTFALFAAVVAPASAAAPKFIGKWRAHSMESKGKSNPVPKGLTITIEFKKGGTFVGVMSMDHNGEKKDKTENGTWTVKGNVLTTTAKRTENMIYRVQGRTLTLTKEEQGQTLILKRE